MNHPAPQSPPSLADLRRRYPQWVIEGPAQLSVFTAELRSTDGHSLHFLAGHDLGELAARLATAEHLGRSDDGGWTSGSMTPQ